MEKVVLSAQQEYAHESIRDQVKEILLECGMEFGFSEMDVCLLACADRGLDGRYAGTHPEFMIGVAQAAREMGASSATLLDPTPTRQPFYGCGFDSGQVALLGSLATIEKTATTSRANMDVADRDDTYTFSLPRAWLNADVCLCLPRLKTDLFAEAHTAAACMLSLLAREQRDVLFNYLLHEHLVRLYRARRPDFVLVDGIVAGEGQGPLHIDDVTLGVIIGGRNAPAVDAIGCALMGMAATGVDHLALLNRAGFGPALRSDVHVVNKHLLQNARAFRRAEWDIAGLGERVRVTGGAHRYCGPGCVGLARQALDPWLQRKTAAGLEPMHCIIGRPIDEIPADPPPGQTLVIGGCAAPFKDRGDFIPGIPPSAADVEMAVHRIQAPGEFAAIEPGARLLAAAGVEREVVADYVRAHLFGFKRPFPRITTAMRIRLVLKSLLLRYVRGKPAPETTIPSHCMGND